MKIPGNFEIKILLTLIIICNLQGYSQNENKEINYFDQSNKIFKENIKTILLHRNGWDLSPPLILFNSTEKLKLSFDDLDANKKDFIYTIEFCDANWKPSDLKQYEYIDGYFEDYIYDYEFSLNTIQPYTHYELVFPTEDLIPTKSGNYILKVFIDDPDSVYFTRRFKIVDQKINIEGKVKQATNIADRYYKQELDFEISTTGYRIVNPYIDLKVVLTQNGRWDNAIRDLKPKMVIGDKLDFNYDKENVFNGGNEFRSFDIKSLKYNTQYVGKIEYTFDGYQVYLKEDQKRTFRVYKTEDDINGRKKIKTEDGYDSDTEAEYVNVHFFLPFPAPLIDGDIHITGALTDWRYSEKSKMDYNFKRKGYEKTLFLKQGYYNYQYVLLMHGKSEGDETFIEGNHSETENDYTIYIYYREPGEDYDKLIGVKHINSLPE